ncbi:MAG: DUF6159 family protein [Thermoplasmatota archaeon]
MFESISRGWKLTKASFRVLSLDKQMLVLPILSGLILVGVWITFAFPAVIALDTGHSATALIILFVLYVASYFVVIFFQAGLVEMTTTRFNGQTPTIKQGLKSAWEKKFRILQWAIVAATVGLILRILENAAQNSKSQLTQIVGQIAIMIAGAAWQVATYFVVPVLVSQDLGPFEAIKTSLSTMRRAWGESATGTITTGILFFLLAIPGILFIVFGMGAATLAGALVGVGIGVLWLIAVWVVNTAVDGILVTALFRYASTGQIPEGFDHAKPPQAQSQMVQFA